MKILFRADGNEEIGAGHVMRCLAIAGKAKEKGFDCVFVTADDSYYHKILNAGIRCVVLGTDFRRLEYEIPKLLEQFEIEKPDRVIIDSYYVTEEYLIALKEKATIIYLDDIAAFAYPVDILINYNIYSLKMDYMKLYKEAGILLPKMLLGSRFAPLRKEFQDVSAKETVEYVRKIFVSVGGSDTECIIMRMIEYLIDHSELTDNKEYHFVVGDFEPDQEKIFDMAMKYKWIVPHCRIREMARLMISCDIAISAAGSTLYELCACGIPTITYVLEDNQIPGENAFQKNGTMKSAGDYRYVQNWMRRLFEEVKELCDNRELREEMSRKMKNLVDGMGAKNIVNIIMEENIVI